jgi:hypothetical protein
VETDSRFDMGILRGEEVKVAGKGVLILMCIFCVSLSIISQENKYCLHIQYNVGLDAHAISDALDAAPVLKVEIGIRSNAFASSDEESETECSAFSIAYIFFPQTLNYYAYSNCYLVKISTDIGSIEKAIDTELSSVYDLYYDKALDLNEKYRQLAKVIK